jgi:hypothetical protein
MLVALETEFRLAVGVDNSNSYSIYKLPISPLSSPVQTITNYPGI